MKKTKKMATGGMASLGGMTGTGNTTMPNQNMTSGVSDINNKVSNINGSLDNISGEIGDPMQDMPTGAAYKRGGAIKLTKVSTSKKNKSNSNW
jgi:hypothetical protein